MVGTLGVAQMPLTEPQVGSLLPQLLTFPVAETEVHIPPPTVSPSSGVVWEVGVECCPGLFLQFEIIVRSHYRGWGLWGGEWLSM